MTVYGASKAYVSSFTVGLSEELKRRDITVTAVCPGPMKTEVLDVGSITGRSPAFEYLPYCDQVRVAAARCGAPRRAGLCTPRLFYKFYRLLAKVTPVKLMVKFTKT
nr:SDR family NAD(P)-dependent oxidoreductase [Oscillibacter sp.]